MATYATSEPTVNEKQVLLAKVCDVKFYDTTLRNVLTIIVNGPSQSNNNGNVMSRMQFRQLQGRGDFQEIQINMDADVTLE